MYKVYRNDLGQIDSINRESDGASIPYNPSTKTFDESHLLTIELREWERENRALDLSDSPPPPPPLDLAKNSLKALIVAEAARRSEALIEGYSAPERDTWDRKLAEAEAFLESGDINTARFLSIEAVTATGADTPEKVAHVTKIMAQRIVSKSDELYTASSVIAGNRARLIRAVEALSDVDSVLAFDYTLGWGMEQ